jgi:Tfp pilus assembly protein PilF
MINITFTEEEIKDIVNQAISASQERISDNRTLEAELILKQTLRVDPECEQALRMLTELLMSQQKGSEAIPYYEKILEKNTTDQVALNNIALCYASTGQMDKSIHTFEKYVKLYPNEPSSHSNLALQFKNVGEINRADIAYQTGIATLPESHDIRFNYGVFLVEQFRFHEAIEQYKKAISLKPDFDLAHFNLSLVNLLLGNYQEGWEGYEWRFGNQVFKKFKDRFSSRPEWQGEDGNNKTILVYNEQGAGDAIQFARYLPELKKRGFKVILEVIYDLVDLMAQCEGVDQVVPQRSKDIPEYDFHVSIGSLPLKLRIYEPFYHRSYIKPSGALGNQFESYSKYTNIGICWAGNPIHRHDNHRSCELKHFKHLNNVVGVKLFSLQKDSRPRFWAGQGVVDLTKDCDDMGVVDMSDLLVNFNYTAAIMQCMKYIVTVDTAVAHIAGAMHLPCYLLLPNLPDWRWGLAGNQSKWYDSVVLCRQTKPGDYESRLKNIAYEVKHKM